MRKDHKILAQALADVFIPEILDELDLCETEFELSPEFKAKMDKLVRKEKKFYFPITKKLSGKTLAIAFTAVIMLSVMCMSVSAVRNTVIDLVERVFYVHTEKNVPEKNPVPETVTVTSTVPCTAAEVTRVSYVSVYQTEMETEIMHTTTVTTGTSVKITDTAPAEVSETAVTNLTAEKIRYEGKYEKMDYFSDTEFIPDISADDVHYGFWGYISADKIDEPYVSGKLSGGMVLKNKEFDNCKSYSIRGISEDIAIIVKSDKCDDYLIYNGIGAVYETLGDMINALNLEKEMKVNGAYRLNGYINDAPELTRYNVDEYFIWNVLFADRQAKKMKAPDRYDNGNDSLLLDIYIDVIGRYSCIGVAPDGYIYTNLIYDICSYDKYSYYYIGKEKAREIIDIAENNYSCDIETNAYIPYYMSFDK